MGMQSDVNNVTVCTCALSLSLSLFLRISQPPKRESYSKRYYLRDVLGQSASRSKSIINVPREHGLIYSPNRRSAATMEGFLFALLVITPVDQDLPSWPTSLD